jgi:hypothetical protein
VKRVAVALAVAACGKSTPSRQIDARGARPIDAAAVAHDAAAAAAADAAAVPDADAAADAAAVPDAAAAAAADAAADAAPGHPRKHLPIDAGIAVTAPPPPPDAGPSLPRGTTWQSTSGGTDGFQLAIDSPAPTTSGTTVHYTLTITPATGFHINWCAPDERDCTPFPVSLALSPPAGLAATSKTAAIDHDHLVLDVAATPAAAGAYSMPGKLKFAVCTDSDCDPKRLALTFTLGAR